MNAACRPIAVQRFKPLDGTKPVYSRRDNTWRPDNDIWIRQQDWQLTVSNHRPVSNVYVQDRKACRCQATSISIWRKWFAKNRYLDRQSAYRCHRWTEKAILRVVSLMFWQLVILLCSLCWICRHCSTASLLLHRLHRNLRTHRHSSDTTATYSVRQKVIHNTFCTIFSHGKPCNSCN